MQQVSSSAARRTAGAIAMVVALLAALLGPVGATSAKPARPLTVSGVFVACECGGMAYVWGWNAVAVEFTGARKGRTYRVGIKGGPTVEAAAYGRRGFVYIPRSEGDFRAGRTYRFVVKEFKGRKLVRRSAPATYTIPTPVGGPQRMHIDTITRGEDEVMVAGETYRITFADGEWEDGIRFASGVDAYFGVESGDDRSGWYRDEDYPLPWDSDSEAPFLEITPPAEFAGTRWNMKIVGYRVATETDRSAGLVEGLPIRGTEWGFSFGARVVAE